MTESPEFKTPMMQQYAAIKKQYPTTILFFRLGDFYEMFLEDAQVGAKVLNITLTSRHKGKDGQIPMAGVPYHAAESYIQKLVKHGYQVAICEQVTEPTKGKEIVEREVIRVVTPSTMLEEEAALATNDYLMTIAYQKNRIGVCLVSIISGEVKVMEDVVAEAITPDHIIAILAEYIERFQPAEILLSQTLYEQSNLIPQIKQLGVSPFMFNAQRTEDNDVREFLQQYYQVDSLEGFALKENKLAAQSLAQAIEYLQATQKNEVTFLKHPQFTPRAGYLMLNSQTVRNLELFGSVRAGKRETTLYSVINNTETAMGGRLLRTWLARPLTDIAQIDQRLDGVAWLVARPELRQPVRDALAQITDTERSLSRLSLGIGNARDGIVIKQTLIQVQKINQLLAEQSLPELVHSLYHRIDQSAVDEILTLLEQAIEDDPPVTINEGKMIKRGYSAELDQLREVMQGGKELLKEIEEREQAQTGIGSLKVGYNKVFGYYIEVSHANSDKVPDSYVRKQTLTNAERYIIPELKEHEERVLNAETASFQLEKELFHQVVQRVIDQMPVIQHIAEFIAQIDIVSGWAELASVNQYIRPEVVAEQGIVIEDGRHPVVEQFVPSGFVPNRISLDADQRMMILTGANMAGKSTYIRQVALSVIMAQLGMFIPAQQARIGIVDQIHTRIGAMDDIAAGMSTFMVEMVETANILNHLSDRSLVILDEVGRGTSTYDGLSIAWAVSEYLLQRSQAMVLFATHYHELTELPNLYDHVQNYHMAVAHQADEVIFLYQVQAGKSSQSYGLEVARRAGLPAAVTKRAHEILADLHIQANAIAPYSGKQLGLFGEK